MKKLLCMILFFSFFVNFGYCQGNIVTQDGHSINVKIDKAGQISSEENVAGTTRHVITNTCAGTNCSAQYNARNDAGHEISLGIGSSTLNIPGSEGANSGALLLESPGNLLIGNLYYKDIVFKNNPDNDGDLSKIIEIGKLDKDGNFSIIGQSFEGMLGEIRYFDLSRSGSITKTVLYTHGWAVCDGTTPATQGISDPIIETTPNLQNKFLRASDDETSGTTGGANSQDLTLTSLTSNENGGPPQIFEIDDIASGTITINTVPEYYEIVPFIKVK